MSAEFPGEASERALAGHGVDPSIKVRAAVAEAIGNGKFDRLVPVLERLLNERGDPVMKIDPESMDTFGKQMPIVFNTNSAVSSSAGFALLNFDVNQTARILKANLGNAYFKSGQLGKAIAAYREAEQMSPRDPDVRANLRFARNQVQGPTLRPRGTRSRSITCCRTPLESRASRHFPSTAR